MTDREIKDFFLSKSKVFDLRGFLSDLSGKQARVVDAFELAMDLPINEFINKMVKYGHEYDFITELFNFRK